MAYMIPRLYCAMARPCSAAIRNQRTASASSSRTPSPLSYMIPRLNCAMASPCSAGLSDIVDVRSVLRRKRRDVECDCHDRGDRYQDQFVHIDCLSSRFTVEVHSVASVLVMVGSAARHRRHTEDDDDPYAP